MGRLKVFFYFSLHVLSYRPRYLMLTRVNSFYFFLIHCTIYKSYCRPSWLLLLWDDFLKPFLFRNHQLIDLFRGLCAIAKEPKEEEVGKWAHFFKVRVKHERITYSASCDDVIYEEISMFWECIVYQETCARRSLISNKLIQHFIVQ